MKLKNVSLIILALCIINIAYAVIIPQNVVNNIDFFSINIQYVPGNINIARDMEGYYLVMDVKFYSLEPYSLIDGVRTYELKNQTYTLKYSKPDFFLCTMNDTQYNCFEEYVSGEWYNEYLSRDFMHRRYLNSLKSTTSPLLIDMNLSRYYQ